MGKTGQTLRGQTQMSEEFKCGCINYGDFKFKLCNKHRNMVLDDIQEMEDDLKEGDKLK